MRTATFESNLSSDETPVQVTAEIEEIHDEFGFDLDIDITDVRYMDETEVPDALIQGDLQRFRQEAADYD